MAKFSQFCMLGCRGGPRRRSREMVACTPIIRNATMQKTLSPTSTIDLKVISIGKSCGRTSFEFVGEIPQEDQVERMRTTGRTR